MEDTLSDKILVFLQQTPNSIMSEVRNAVHINTQNITQSRDFISAWRKLIAARKIKQTQKRQLAQQTTNGYGKNVKVQAWEYSVND